MELITTEAHQQAEQIADVLATFETYVVATDEDYTAAADHLKAVKAKSKELEALRKEMTRPLDESKAKIMEFFRRPSSMLERAEGLIKNAMGAWHQKQEAIREAQRREQQRQLDEIRAAQAAKLEAEAAAKLKEGREAEAMACLVAAEELPTTVKVAAAPKPAGVSYRTLWRWKVVDFKALPDQCKMVNDKVLNAMVVSTKGETSIPGVEVYSEQVVASR